MHALFQSFCLGILDIFVLKVNNFCLDVKQPVLTFVGAVKYTSNMAIEKSALKGIKDIFYETRVLMGREYTLRRFATEVLGGSIDPVMLGYIEKGTRFPSEPLVRRLAAVRNQDAHELLALLWRDRMLYAFGKELRRVMQAPKAVSGVEDAELVVLISQAIAALPDDGSWLTLGQWRRAYRAAPPRRPKQPRITESRARQIEEILQQREIIEVQGTRVRRRGRHFVAQTAEERQALALEFCTLFLKGLLDKLVLSEVQPETYMRNHYLHIDSARVPEFQQRLEEALRALAEEFATDTSMQTRFLNVLVTATPL